MTQPGTAMMASNCLVSSAGSMVLRPPLTQVTLLPSPLDSNV